MKAALTAFALAAWFLGQTWKGLLIYFTDDDLMNTYQAWILPLPKLIVANLTPFTSVYRPLGSALYRTIYFFAGLDPLPYRIAAYTLMLINLWLVYHLARLLTGSKEVALLCALLFAYHRRLMDLFLNDGTIYDILCFTFVCAAFCVYVSAGRRIWGALAFLALYTLALNSKEMAVTLPAVLLAYELIYFPPAEVFKRWPLWIAAVMTAVAIRAKTGPGAAFTGNPDYALQLSAHQFFATSIPFLSHLFFLKDDAFSAAGVVITFALVWAVAMAMRDKTLLLAAAFLTIIPLPVNFITYRGFFVMYLPLFGWALYFAALLNVLRAKFKVPQPAMIAAVASVLFFVQIRDTWWTFERVDPAQFLIRALNEDLPRLAATLPRDAKVLFLRDGFAADSWAPLYITRLRYGSADIAIDRVKKGESGTDHTLVIDYCGARYQIAPCP